MSEPLKLRVFDNGAPVFETNLTGVLVLGRQDTAEPEPYHLMAGNAEAPARVIIARVMENNVSRHHVRLEPRRLSGTVRVSNHSQRPLPVGQPADWKIDPGGSGEYSPPFLLHLPPRTISVEPGDSPGGYSIASLGQMTPAPDSLPTQPRPLQPLPSDASTRFGELAAWLHETMGVLQSTVGSADFQKRAAEALVRIFALHAGRVLRLRGDRWEVEHEHLTPAVGKVQPPSQHVLTLVRTLKRTFWQVPQQTTFNPSPPSLTGVETVVAAPILDAQENVIGALYGERYEDKDSPAPHVGALEGTLVELLACGVAAGLARQEKEKSAVESQVRFEQFFGPHLARKLVNEPNLLEGREVTVTLLFCDVRGFSTFSEKLKPKKTLLWMNDVMDTLSERVLAEDGVLVDYIGDELFAMWGAPEDQLHQEARAARAALAMLDSLVTIDEIWHNELGGHTRIGIGINTGPAQVGNTGSRLKFKYGPLGNAVNLASRVQGLTKYLRCPLLVTGTTRQELKEGFIARRICETRVVNIDKPVKLYEVAAAGSEQRRQYFADSEAALDALEAGNFAAAARKAGTLLLDHTGDGPLLLTLSRATNALMQGPDSFDPVWEPPGK